MEMVVTVVMVVERKGEAGCGIVCTEVWRGWYWWLEVVVVVEVIGR